MTPVTLITGASVDGSGHRRVRHGSFESGDEANRPIAPLTVAAIMTVADLAAKGKVLFLVTSNEGARVALAVLRARLRRRRVELVDSAVAPSEREARVARADVLVATLALGRLPVRVEHVVALFWPGSRITAPRAAGLLHGNCGDPRSITAFLGAGAGAPVTSGRVLLWWRQRKRALTRHHAGGGLPPSLRFRGCEQEHAAAAEFLAELEANENAHSNLFDGVASLLSAWGLNPQAGNAEVSGEDYELVNEARQKLRAEEAKAIAEARVLSDKEALELATTCPWERTEAERVALARHEIKTFLGLPAVTAREVLAYDDGRLCPRVRRFQDVAAFFEGRHDDLFGIDPAALEGDPLLSQGRFGWAELATNLLRAFTRPENPDAAEPEQFGPWLESRVWGGGAPSTVEQELLRGQAQAIAVILGFDIRKMSDSQLMGEILTRMGVSTLDDKANQRREYRCNPASIATMKAHSPGERSRLVEAGQQYRATLRPTLVPRVWEDGEGERLGVGLITLPSG